MILLGIETSCDETAAALVDDQRRILANIVFSQLDEHRPFGGVVPEIAARSHVTRLDDIIRQALATAQIGWSDIDGIAATCGPGLIGGVFVGAMTAQAIALARSLPFIAVNHLEGHALTVRLTDNIAFPYLLLLVSGGHTALIEVTGLGQYRQLGQTLDDAVGESFDKAAKMLGLGYPGGPLLEHAARSGNPKRFALPRPLLGRPGCDFSFSGLKTAVRLAAQSLPQPLSPQDSSDLAASFQQAIADSLADRCRHAIADFIARHGTGHSLVIAGGVAANLALRSRLAELAETHAMRCVAPPVSLCTDNGAMIAWAGLERLRAGLTDAIGFAARPRWPLHELEHISSE